MDALFDNLGKMYLGGDNHQGRVDYGNNSEKNRMYKMLSGIPEHKKQQFKYDSEASWSFTDLRIGRALCKKMLELPGVSAQDTILDATASVGGNSIAFANCFEHVNAVELDPDRKEMLDHNVKLLGLEKKITTYQGFAQEYIGRVSSDIVFFDPPWGVDYKKYPAGTMKITIGGPDGKQQAFEELILSTRKFAKYCVVKLPVNYDLQYLRKKLTGAAEEVYTEWHGRPNTSVVIIFKIIK